MYSVKLDEQGYFTGSYAKVGKVDGGIDIPHLPYDTNKATCCKWAEREIINKIQVPVMDEETGEQLVDEDGELVFETKDEIIYVMSWIFDEEKYKLESEAKELEELRQKREKAFEIIDKYQLVLYYNDLTDEQKVDLSEYRRAWLDATKTKTIPSKPSWIL